MAAIITERMTHDYEGELVVFLLGMRINQLWRPDRWLPVFSAMGRMLPELMKDPDSGLLGFRVAFGGGGPMVIQYWESTEKLYAYASKPDAEHRPAWTAFNRRIKKAPGSVGIWHETYQVARAETIYAHMPVFGLAKATAAVPVRRRGERAVERLASGSGRAA